MIAEDTLLFTAQMAFEEPFRQIKPLTTHDFNKWLNKMDVGFMDWETLHFLWLHGVVCPVAVSQDAIVYHGRDTSSEGFFPMLVRDGVQLFGDLGNEEVSLPYLDVGRGDFPDLAEALWWHPLQLWQCVQIQNALGMSCSSDRRLRKPEYKDLDQWALESCQRRVESLANSGEFRDFRKLLALMIAVEPCVHGAIHGSVHFTVGENLDQYCQWREEFLREDFLERCMLTLEDVKGWHERISLDAHLHDPLREIRILVNQIKPRIRAKMRGEAGKANVLFDHAETLRRHLEWTYNVDLLEENDYQWRERSQRGKENLFGSKRVFDRDRNVLRRILRYYGVDHAVRIALLLEGPTEIAFFKRVAELWGVDLIQRGIAFYNLAGKDRLDRNHILTQQLETLGSEEVFAYAALDHDGGGDHVRILKRYAKSGLLSADYILWTPDFESHNFTTEELALAATNLARQDGSDVEFSSAEIEKLMGDEGLPAGSAMNKLAGIKRTYVTKGEGWCKALAEVVCAEGVEVPKSLKDEHGNRQRFTMLAMLIRGYDANYRLTLAQTMSKH